MKICNKCQTQNPDEFLFCQNCFAQLPDTSSAVVPAEILPEEPEQIVAIEAEESLPALDQSVNYPVEDDMFPSVEGSMFPAAVPSATHQRFLGEKGPGQLGAGRRSLADIWGPFAGYGTRGRHHSWLLDEQGESAKRLRDVVTARFEQRQIPNAQIHRRVLTAKGIIVENRPYYLIQRGIATLGLHIARFGEDLFISQVTYTLGPINPLRVLILALMLLFQLFMMYGYGSSLQSSIGTFNLMSGYTGNLSSFGVMLCCIGPLGAINTLLLVLAGIYSLYKFLTEKDPLALLRRLPNEFEIDDIVALEKSVEETVRQSLDAIDLDSSKMPPALLYGPTEGRII
jgi:hypothetical protein